MEWDASTAVCIIPWNAQNKNARHQRSEVSQMGPFRDMGRLGGYTGEGQSSGCLRPWDPGVRGMRALRPYVLTMHGMVCLYGRVQVQRVAHNGEHPTYPDRRSPNGDHLGYGLRMTPMSRLESCEL